MVKHYKDSNIWLNFKKSFDSNELSHAYIIESDSINLGELIALDIVSLLLPNPKKNIDCLRVRPKNKSNSITTEDIEEIIQRLSKTSFAGGWKCCIISQADKINLIAQNKLLKILEEPPKKTLILLTTINSSAIISTVMSRCKKLKFKKLKDDVIKEMGDLFVKLPPKNGLEASLLAEKFYYDYMNNFENNSILENISFESNEESTASIDTNKRNLQNLIIKNIIYWFRDLLLIEESSSNIHFKNYKDELLIQSRLSNKDYILKSINIFEQLLKKIEYNISDKYLINDAFRKIIHY